MLDGLIKTKKLPEDLQPYFKEEDNAPDNRNREFRHIIAASCEAHDLGHPPFGHNGERALHAQLNRHGGFEGNAQTIRILVKLERYTPDKGLNPSRRFLLAVLKYPVAFSDYPKEDQIKNKPPKCYYSEHRDEIEWALDPFSSADRAEFITLGSDHKGRLRPKHKTFDASIMDCADDIAFGVHDLEDIVARELVSKKDLLNRVTDVYKKNPEFNELWRTSNYTKLYKDSLQRKRMIGELVNLLMTNCEIKENPTFTHPLLRYKLSFKKPYDKFVAFLKDDLTFHLVISRPKVQMLEKKGYHLVKRLYEEYITSPEQLIPGWDKLDPRDSKERRVCDYIAGMTDSFAVKMYNRFFTPGFGSSSDEM